MQLFGKDKKGSILFKRQPSGNVAIYIYQNDTLLDTVDLQITERFAIRGIIEEVDNRI